MRKIVLIAHNLRSAHNVGSLLRTADGMGVDTVYLTGYTPHPTSEDDERLPHESIKVNNKIHKTALGAELNQRWVYQPDIKKIITDLKQNGFYICALEQATNATLLPNSNLPYKLAIIIGRETKGIEQNVLSLCDEVVMIPMIGKKESFNVVQAAAMCLYHVSLIG